MKRIRTISKKVNKFKILIKGWNWKQLKVHKKYKKKKIGNKFKKLKSKKVRFKDSIKKIQKGKWHKFKRMITDIKIFQTKGTMKFSMSHLNFKRREKKKKNISGNDMFITYQHALLLEE